MARKPNRREVPKRIDDTPENTAAAVLGQLEKEQWRYMDGHTGQQPASAD